MSLWLVQALGFTQIPFLCIIHECLPVYFPDNFECGDHVSLIFTLTVTWGLISLVSPFILLDTGDSVELFQLSFVFKKIVNDGAELSRTSLTQVLFVFLNDFLFRFPYSSV